MVHLESVFNLKMDSEYSFDFELMATFLIFQISITKRKIGKQFLVDFKCFCNSEQTLDVIFVVNKQIKLIPKPETPFQSCNRDMI